MLSQPLAVVELLWQQSMCPDCGCTRRKGYREDEADVETLYLVSDAARPSCASVSEGENGESEHAIVLYEGSSRQSAGSRSDGSVWKAVPTRPWK